jgi:antitoxin component YwqK of YwqJK toxin-antitoxin module
MQLKHIFLFFFIFPFSLFSREDHGKIDSIAFYGNGEPSYIKETYWSRKGIYIYHENGRLASVEYNYDNKTYNYQSYSEAGNLLFDTSFSPGYRALASHYYLSGAKKSYVIQKFKVSPNDPPVLFQYFSWDENGELNYYKELDTSGKLVADEHYPWRKYRGVKFYRSFYPNGYLKEQGFYKPSMNDSVEPMNKYGACFSFFSNGQMKSAGLFVDNVPWGMHYEYDAIGQLVSEKYYEKGIESESEPGNTILPVSVTNKYDTITGYSRGQNVYEGLYQTGKRYRNEYDHQYFFRGAHLATVPDPSPAARMNERRLLDFGFPPADVWCSWNLYSLRVNEKGNIITITEGMNGNKYTFSDSGELIEFFQANAKRTCNYGRGGLISKIETTGQLRTGFCGRGSQITFPVDTTKAYDKNGRVCYMTIYGTRGQVIKTMARKADSTWESRPNQLYQHFYIQMGGQWVEILDHDASFTGEWKFVCDNGNKVSEGYYDGGKEGEWRDYDEITGVLRLVQQYHNNQQHAKGKYKHYDEHGKLSEKGRYNKNYNMTGVWKSYSSRWLPERTRYIDGYRYEFERCKECCPNKKGRRRNQLRLIWKDKSVWQLRKCQRFRGAGPF